MTLTIRHNFPGFTTKRMQASSAPVAAAQPARGPQATTDLLQTPALKAALPFAGVRRGLQWLQLGRARKRLQMLETVSFGEKRFVALVQVDGRQFLIGGAPSNVGMLAELSPEETFQQVLREATQTAETSAPTSQAAAEDATSVAVPVAQQPVPTTAAHSEPAAAVTSPLEAFTVHEDEQPFSLSPTLQAVLQKEQAASPAPNVNLAQEQHTVEPVSQPSSPASATTAGTNFTFQLSSTLLPAADALRSMPATHFGRDAARRKAEAWKLKEALA